MGNRPSSSQEAAEGTSARQTKRRKSKQKSTRTYKVWILGASNAGKSSIILRYCKNEFRDDFISTIGADFLCKTVDVDENNTANLQIWDPAGQERFRMAYHSFYRGSAGLFIAFDLAEKESFNEAPKWIKEAISYQVTNIILIGNKSDLPREVAPADAEALATENNIPYFECSCLRNEGLEDAFHAMANRCHANFLAGKDQ